MTQNKEPQTFQSEDIHSPIDSGKTVTVTNIDFSNAIVQFNVTDAALKELAEQAKGLAIKDVNDREGYEAVRLFVGDIKDRWVALEKARKDQKADALEYGRRVDKEAARIDAKLREIAKDLIERKAVIDAEKEAIKEAKAKAEQKRIEDIQQRIANLRARGMIGRNVPAIEIEQLLADVARIEIDDTYDEFVEQAERARDDAQTLLGVALAERKLFEHQEAERAAIAAQQAQEREELDRRRKEQEEREQAENARLELQRKAEQKILDEQRAELKKQQDEMDRQRRELEAAQKKIQDELDAKARAQREAEILQEAQEKARQLLQEEQEAAEAKRLADEKAEKERLAAEEAARPDVEKVRMWLAEVLRAAPRVTAKRAVALLAEAKDAIGNVLDKAG